MAPAVATNPIITARRFVERVHSIFDTMLDGVYITDRWRRIVYWNDAATALTGFTREDMLGASCHANLLRHIDLGCTRELCNAGCPVTTTLEKGTSLRLNVYAHRKDGSRFCVEVSTAPVHDRQGRVQYVVETFRPIEVAEQQRQAELTRLRDAAYQDALTELPNRRYLVERINAALAARTRYHAPFGVLVLDADHFKSINDQHGHAVGDAALKHLARLLQRHSRTSDMVGRWGGEEFVALCFCTRPQHLLKAAERLRVAVAGEPFVFTNGKATTIPLAVSVGAAMAVRNDTAASLVQRADEALYLAKHDGRNVSKLKPSRPQPSA